MVYIDWLTGIKNGGFELQFNYWVVSGSPSLVSTPVHKGSRACLLHTGEYIEQTLVTPVAVNNMASCGIWLKNYGGSITVSIIATYSDASTTTITVSGNVPSYQFFNFINNFLGSQLTAGKIVTKFRISASSNVYVDDFTLFYGSKQELTVLGFE